MIADAEFCIFAKKNEPFRRLLIHKGANPKIAHWSSTFPIGNEMRPSSGNQGAAKAMGPDFYLYDEHSAQVGTLKFFQFDHVDPEAQTVLLYYDRHIECQLDHASAARGEVRFERKPRGPLVFTHTRGNTQLGGPALR